MAAPLPPPAATPAIAPIAAPAAADSISRRLSTLACLISPSGPVSDWTPCSPGTPATVAASGTQPCLVLISSKLSSRRECNPLSTSLTWPLTSEPMGILVPSGATRSCASLALNFLPGESLAVSRVSFSWISNCVSAGITFGALGPWLR